MPILVRNLPRTLTEQELEALFSPFGKVTSCDLVMDPQSGQSKGFGFVEMEKQDATDNAISELNAKKLEDKKIRVKWSNQDDHRMQTEEPNTALPQSVTDKNESETQIKNAWHNARPKLNEEPGEYE